MNKPSKPREDFPLFPHNNGQWTKKIRGKFYYFGKWDDPFGAEANYLKFLDEPAPKPVVENATEKLNVEEYTIDLDQLRVQDAINLHLTFAKKRVENNELSIRTYSDRKYAGDLVVNQFGNRIVDELRPLDWAELRSSFAKGRSVVGLGNLINRTRTIFKWLSDNEYIAPARYGTSFAMPAKRLLRKHAQQFNREYSAEEIRTLIASARQPVKAMIYLGINCGLGNSDCASLEAKHLDLKKGWLDFPRPKTAVDRRAKLWPETVQAIQEWFTRRPKFDSPLIFITRQGNPWVQCDTENSPVSKEFRKLQEASGIFSLGRGFYSLRRMVETIGGRCKDQIAVDYVMGHADQTMGGVYRLSVEDDRLEAVSNAIRDWLEPEKINFLKIAT